MSVEEEEEDAKGRRGVREGDVKCAEELKVEDDAEEEEKEEEEEEESKSKICSL